MSKNRTVNVDYEELCKLFELDPEEFERTRKRLIDEEISRRPPEVQERLEKFQWVLDVKRKRCKNALEACFMFHEMLMDNIYGENGLVRNLERLVEAVKGTKSTEESMAIALETKVLNFPHQERSKRIHCG